jgi:two-component system CheB/CheR fusion protein
MSSIDVPDPYDGVTLPGSAETAGGAYQHAQELLREQARRLAFSRYVPAYVICDENLNVIESRGDTSGYRMAATGAVKELGFSRLRPEWQQPINSALVQSESVDTPISSRLLLAGEDGRLRWIHYSLTVLQHSPARRPWMMLSFERSSAVDEQVLGPLGSTVRAAKNYFGPGIARLMGAAGGLARDPASAMLRSDSVAGAIAHTMAESLLILDMGLKIEWANRAFYETFDTTASEVLRKSLFSLDSDEWRAAPLRRHLRALRSDETLMRYHLTHSFARIGLRTFRMNAMRMRVLSGDRLLLIFENVTGEEAANHRLRDQTRQRDEYLAMLAHELRTPLATTVAAMQVWLQASRQTDLDSQKRAQKIFADQLEYQARMITQLLSVSRVTQGVIALHLERFDLAQLVQDAVHLRQVQSAQRELRITLDTPAAGLMVSADRMRLEQILSNLLDNAVQYTPAGGAIHVGLAARGRDVTLAVSDTGIGMAADVLPGIFEIFSKSGRALDSRPGRLGLGLSLVRGLVQLHGGEIKAHSEGASLGSSFVVTLPIALAMEAASCGPPEGLLVQVAPAFPGLNIVLVEDNVDLAELSASILQEAGHDVRVAYTGSSGLELVRLQTPDVVLLDIGLPDINGYKVAELIRASVPGAGVTLIALTGFGSAQDYERTRKAGFDHHVVKPADFNALENLMRQARPRLHE